MRWWIWTDGCTDIDGLGTLLYDGDLVEIPPPVLGGQEGSLAVFKVLGRKEFNRFFWMNEPEHSLTEDRLVVHSRPDTDFWQRTHYGVRRDNGHVYCTEIDYDFKMSVKTIFHPKKQYDQCGLIVLGDSENWIKTSVEFETPKLSRLGSVVTNYGYSDWATMDLHTGLSVMWYCIQRRGMDFMIEYSADGSEWSQMRVTHLHQASSPLRIGIYACSPNTSSFVSEFESFSIEKAEWGLTGHNSQP